MNKRTKLGIAIASVLAAGAGAAGIAAATGGGDDENSAPITGSALDQASAAALSETGGGTVTESETGDEESYYEIGVKLDDGTSVDVQLDRDFNVVGSESDGNENESGPNHDD